MPIGYSLRGQKWPPSTAVLQILSAMRVRHLAGIALVLVACDPGREKPEPPAARPSILLITLDTTRADSIGPDAKDVETPRFNALAARGLRFRQAYATTPQTLPSHTSMMTGLYPGGHGVHENGRHLDPAHPLLAERLRASGYRTAAFVSSFALASQFGLARGFDVYQDDFGRGRVQRTARETTDLALEYLARHQGAPIFLWVHYYDPHYPYEPPEPFRTQYAAQPYLGEVAAMDQELGRLVEAFERSISGPAAILAVGDHGEGLGDHGEQQHGNLVYQETMLVPFVAVLPGVAPAVTDVPVSIRRVHGTILEAAGESAAPGSETVILGEAMQPFLQYGWQPQVMAVHGTQKAIQAGTVEIYDLQSDPEERNDLGGRADLSREVRQALRDYPIPAPGAPADAKLTDEERRRLASLGYVTSNARPVVRPDAPKPRDMAHLFADLDRASALFVAEEYRRAVPLLEKILESDPGNVSTALRLATAHSALGNEEQALAAFRSAEAIAPDSVDVQHFLALHYVRAGEWDRAAPRLERVLAESPGRIAAIEALAVVRERQGRLQDALDLRLRADAVRDPSAAELLHTGTLAMRLANTPVAIQAFERARGLQDERFEHHLELGVLYLESRRFAEARDALDRVPSGHPGYPMALFKRAQVSVLLREPDQAARISRARENADAVTRQLIERERLFR